MFCVKNEGVKKFVNFKRKILHILIQSTTTLFLRNMKNFTLILASFLLLFGSCTVQKRTYRPGFTVQWKGDKFQKTNDDAVQEDVVIKEVGITVFEKTTSDAIIPNMNNVASTANNDLAYEASNDLKTPKEIILIEEQPKEVGSRAEKNPSYQTKKYSRFSNGDKLSNKASIGADDEGGNGALKVIGWIFIIMGIILLIFVSILVGILLMLLGLLFFVVGKNN